jgi:trans-AT polyketide synthase, acyltransferase and oxidoreductase domains
MEAWLFPGQGSQRVGMGADAADSPLWSRAEALLGYSVRDQCLSGADPGLADTRFVQPALYTVNAIAWERAAAEGAEPDFLAGHSLGEFNALLAAGCFDFETGLALVRARGRLMSEAGGGTMTAVVGASAAVVSACLASAGVDGAAPANHNSASQIVLSGTEDGVAAAEEALREAGIGRTVRLRVSAAFHSPLMATAADAFAAELDRADVAEPRIPVIANAIARPYGPGEIRALLSRQMTAPVLWWQSMSHLLRRGVAAVRELGPGRVLTGLWAEATEQPHEPPPSAPAPQTAPDPSEGDLGSASFRREYGLRHACLSGSMFQGIASPELVAAMANAGLFGFLGAGGLTTGEVEKALDRLDGELGCAGRFGVNLLASPDRPERESELVDLLLRRGIRHAEVSGYTAPTEAVVRYRFTDAAADGPRRLIAKVSRPEVARAFAAPPTERMLRGLVERGELHPADAAAAARLPVAEDLCVEADSGGHTDGGNPLVLLPAMIRLRDEQTRRHGYDRAPRVGAAGGIGTPDAAAAAFGLGADFVVTGSINQCTVQADTSEAVKELLATLDVHDTAYAPAGDMFEHGARVQVVRKGTLFAARGNKLYELYRRHDALGDLDARTRTMLEERCFRRPLAAVEREVEQRLLARGGRALERFRADPKHRMALVFRHYFWWTNRLARDGDPAMRADYQIHCGPAMGALNGYLAGTALADHRRRDAADLALRLMRDAADRIGRGRGRRP